MDIDWRVILLYTATYARGNLLEVFSQ